MAASILVVDDDESIRELLRLHLRAAGYDVVLKLDATVGLSRRDSKPARLSFGDRRFLESLRIRVDDETIDVLIGGYMSKQAAMQDYEAALRCGGYLHGGGGGDGGGKGRA